MPETVPHVVVFVQENHTTDNYFASMRAFGANAATGWPVKSNPSAHDQAHTHAAYAKWLHAQQTGATTQVAHTQFDNLAILPYYAYLATQTRNRP
ncbi:MAG: phospholipase [Pseudonocardiales bacterium]|nr:phospholipase [Pseudonocardiales bacterium]